MQKHTAEVSLVTEGNCEALQVSLSNVLFLRQYSSLTNECLDLDFHIRQQFTLGRWGKTSLSTFVSKQLRDLQNATFYIVHGGRLPTGSFVEMSFE